MSVQSVAHYLAEFDGEVGRCVAQEVEGEMKGTDGKATVNTDGNAVLEGASGNDGKAAAQTNGNATGQAEGNEAAGTINAKEADSQGWRRSGCKWRPQPHVELGHTTPLV